MYTTRVNDACLPHHLCPSGGLIPGPTGPEASALPLSHGSQSCCYCISSCVFLFALPVPFEHDKYTCTFKIAKFMANKLGAHFIHEMGMNLNECYHTVKYGNNADNTIEIKLIQFAHAKRMQFIDFQS